MYAIWLYLVSLPNVFSTSHWILNFLSILSYNWFSSSYDRSALQSLAMCLKWATQSQVSRYVQGIHDRWSICRLSSMLAARGARTQVRHFFPGPENPTKNGPDILKLYGESNIFRCNTAVCVTLCNYIEKLCFRNRTPVVGDQSSYMANAKMKLPLQRDQCYPHLKKETPC